MTDNNSEKLNSRIAPEVRAMGEHRVKIASHAFDVLRGNPDTVEYYRRDAIAKNKTKFDTVRVLPPEFTPEPQQSALEATIPADYNPVAEADAILAAENTPAPNETPAPNDADLDVEEVRARVKATYGPQRNDEAEPEETKLEDAYASK